MGHKKRVIGIVMAFFLAIMFYKPVGVLADSEQQYSEEHAAPDNPIKSAADAYEPNDSVLAAYAYSSVPSIRSTITGYSQVYQLCMKSASLHDASDVDYYSISLTANVEYICDIRNVGERNWRLSIIQLDASNNEIPLASTDTSFNAGNAEKYFSFKAPSTGTYYIKVDNNGTWIDGMNYFFYVAPKDTVLNISFNLPSNGGVTLTGSTYKTFTLNLSNAFPADALIGSFKVVDYFPSGGSCIEIDKYIQAQGSSTKYYNDAGTGDYWINIPSNSINIAQIWTIAGKCHNGTHHPYWSPKYSGRFYWVFKPYYYHGENYIIV